MKHSKFGLCFFLMFFYSSIKAQTEPDYTTVPTLNDVTPDVNRAFWMYDEGFFGAGTHFLGGARDVPNINQRWHAGYGRAIRGHYRADEVVTNSNVLGDRVPTIVDWNLAVEKFNVEQLADDLQEAGVGWFYFTIGQTRGFIATPSEVYDANMPTCAEFVSGRFHNALDVCLNWDGSETEQRTDFTSERDLVNDLADALHKRGIRMVAYLPYEIPSRLEGNSVITTLKPWYVHYIKEISERWGKKLMLGG